MIKNKNASLKEKKKNTSLTSELIFWKGKKIIGILISLISLVFLIFEFLPIQGITTIHSYTVGAIFGFFSPLFYTLTFLYGMIFLFEGKISLWIKVRYLFLWYLVFSVAVFLIGSSIYYILKIEKASFLELGSSIWIKTYLNWWENFTLISETSGTIIPNTLSPGIIGFFFFGIFSSIGTMIFALIFATVIISMGFFYFVFGSPISKVQERVKLTKIKKLDEINYKTNVLDLTREDNLTKEIDIKPHIIETKSATIENNLIKKTNLNDTKNKASILHVISSTYDLEGNDNAFDEKISYTKATNVSPINTSAILINNSTENFSFSNNTDENILQNEAIAKIMEEKNKTNIAKKTEKTDSNEIVFFGNLLDNEEKINDKYLPKKIKKEEPYSWKSNELEKTFTDNTKVSNKDNLDQIENLFKSNKTNNEEKNQKTYNIESEEFFPFDDPFK